MSHFIRQTEEKTFEASKQHCRAERRVKKNQSLTAGNSEEIPEGRALWVAASHECLQVFVANKENVLHTLWLNENDCERRKSGLCCLLGWADKRKKLNCSRAKTKRFSLDILLISQMQDGAKEIANQLSGSCSWWF